MSVEKGTVAPSFSLYNIDKQEVKLSDYKGKNLLILFFPLAFTGVCTTELCTIRDDIGTYSNVDADVVAISVDSLFTLEVFAQQQNLSFPLLSDFNKEASEAYGVLYDEFPAFGMKGVSKRAAFIVDKEGKIQYSEVCDSPGDLPNFEAIKETLASL